MRLKAGLIFLAAAGGIFSLGALVAPPWADATNAGTAVSSTCGADGRWVVAMSVTSQYDGVIHIRLDDPHGPTPLMALAAFATKTITEHPDTGSTTWTWAWMSTDGHLTGPAVSGTATRPDGCGTPPPTSGTTTTTTCAQAIPPRSDCAPPAEVTTSPTSSPSTSTPAIPPTTLDTTPSPTVSGGTATSMTPTSLARQPARSSSPSIPANLPVTGTGSTIVWVAVALLLGGSVAILVTVRRRRP